MSDQIIVLERSQAIRRYRYGLVGRRSKVRIVLLVLAALGLVAVVAWGQPVKELAPLVTTIPKGLQLAPQPTAVTTQPVKVVPLPVQSPVPLWIALHYRCIDLGNNLFSFVPIEDVHGSTLTMSCVNCECPSEEK